MELTFRSITELSNALARKECTADELFEAHLDRVRAVDPKLRSFITVTEDAGRAMAHERDAERSRGKHTGILDGIPASIKDVICTKGIKTTAASHMLEEYIPPYDATVVARLKDAGMTLVGKTNCDSFAHGSSTEYSDFFPSKNPWDTERVPGGSSGGAAASVASGECVYAIGTDTGGSIRHPAAFCGVVGLKPTYGSVSRYGLIAMTSSTDCPGVIARSVLDTSIVFNAIAGPDGRDANAVSHAPTIDLKKLIAAENLKGVKLGIVKECQKFSLNSGVRDALDVAYKKLEALGAELVEISLPLLEKAVAVYYVITPAEVSSNLGRYDGIRFGHSEEGATFAEAISKARSRSFGPEVMRRILVGTYVLSAGYVDAYYKQAARVRTKLRDEFASALQDVDAIITPTTPNLPFRFGANSKDPLAMYLEDIFLAGVSLAGLPAVSVPCGFAKPEDGDAELPVGLQIIGPAYGEEKIMQFAHAYENATDWHTKHPAL
ncbi:MAG: Asp-tRNA(Asn)/Glu-tRNA(Gln) amidotransferase subunit GatA [bacterium]|nr:Asp-tRNA(Asn)/Glu-tRNA(Gln) amidotransferase subunit GatA [bacterium]